MSKSFGGESLQYFVATN